MALLHRLALRMLVWLGLAGFTAGTPLLAQQAESHRFTLIAQGIPLEQALEELASRAGIDLVYSERLVAGKTAFCAVSDADVEAALRCVLRATRVDFVRSSSGTYVLIEARQQEAVRGHLTGSIIDEVTGQPLPFANVVLADAAAGTTTNEDGLFGFSQLFSGTHRVVVSYVGYRTRVDSVVVRPGQASRMQIRMQPEAVVLDPVVVTALVPRWPSERLGRAERIGVELAPVGVYGTADVARGASLVTGVSTQQPLADIHIQGGASGEHLTLLDGVPVRDPVSLGRHLSAFSPLAIERLRVEKAGFGVEHGSHLSGLVLVDQDLSASGPLVATLTVDPLSVNGKLKGRLELPGERAGTYMAALRTSTWDVYQDPSLHALLSNWHTPDPLLASRWLQQPVTTSTLRWFQNRPSVQFSDAHAAFRVQLSPFRILHASAYRATNGIRSDMRGIQAKNADEQELMYTLDDYVWTNWVAQVRHSWILGARVMASVQGWGSWHDSRYGYQALRATVVSVEDPTRQYAGLDSLGALIAGAPPGSSEGNQVREAGFVARMTHSLSSSQQLDLGIEATHTDSRFVLRNGFLRPFQYEGQGWEWSGFVMARTGIGPYASLEAGVRTAFLPVRRTVYAEPRAALRVDRPAGALGDLALRFSTGLYRQYTNQYELTSTGSTAVVPSIRFWLPVDRSVAPPWVVHFAADALLVPTAGWTFRAESYLKLQPRLVDIDYARILEELGRTDAGAVEVIADQSAFVGAVDGRSYGASASLQRAAAWGSLSVGYSYSHAVRRYNGRFDGRQVQVPWNEPHRVVTEARFPLLEYLTATATGIGSWGRRWGLRRTYYDFLPGLDTGVFDLNDPERERVSPYLTLDVGLTYEQLVGPTRVRFRAMVLNLYDRRNVYDYSLQQAGDGFERVPRVLPGRQVVLSLRLDV